MDLVLRAIVAFFFILVLTRVVGRRELSSLEPFDLILLVVVGDLVQQGVTQNDFSLTGMLLVGGTIALLTVLVSCGSFKVPWLRPVLDGEPVIVVQDGEPIRRNLDRNRITQDELLAAARRQGLASLERVQWGLLVDERPHVERVEPDPARDVLARGAEALAEELSQQRARLGAPPPVVADRLPKVRAELRGPDPGPQVVGGVEARVHVRQVAVGPVHEAG